MKGSSTPPSPAPPGRWLRGLAIGAVGLIVLIAGLCGWLVGTSAGLRFALARVQAATDGALHVQHATGHLAGPLDLTNASFRDANGLEIQVAKIELDVSLSALWHRTLRVRKLTADGIVVNLPPNTASTDDGKSGMSSLSAPLNIQLDQAHLGSIRIRKTGQTLFASDQLKLAGSWTHDGIQLKQLALQAPAGRVQLNGTLSLGNHDRGDGTASFRWKMDDTSYAGTLAASSDGALAHLDLKFSLPSTAELQLDLRQDDLTWKAKLTATPFDPKPLLGTDTLTLLGININGHGDQRSGALSGQLDLNTYQVQLAPLEAALSPDFKRLTLQRLVLTSPQIKGELRATGTLQLDNTPIGGQLDLQWRDLQLPADWLGQTLASHGELQIRGNKSQYHAEGALDIGPPDRLASLRLNLDGTPSQLDVHTLTLKQPQGELNVNGNLTLQPLLSWKAEARAHQFDPGQLFAGWNGALDFDLASQGSLPQDRPDLTLEIRQLNGKLRQRAITGSGKLHLAPTDVVDGRLVVASGQSSIRVDAQNTSSTASASNDITLTLATASLGDWLPYASGHLNGTFRLRGRPPALSINGQLQGRALVWQQQQAGVLQLTANLSDIGHPSGQLDLQLNDVDASGLRFQHVSVRADGSTAQHRLNLNALGPQLSLGLTLNGRQHDASWRGTLSTMNLAPQGLPSWRLQAPAQLSYDKGALSLTELCLTAGIPSLCLRATQDQSGNLIANYRLRNLPLALLANAAGESQAPVHAEGAIDGDGQINRNATGELNGNASITSAQGSLSYADHADAPLIAYEKLSVTAALSPAGQHIEAHAGMSDGGRLDGQLVLSGAQHAMTGQLDVHLNTLSFIDLLSDEVANVNGHLNGRIRFAGTLQQPTITGHASVDSLSAEIPSAGLKLEQGKLTLDSSDTQHLKIDGSVHSGDGTLNIDGNAGIGASTQTSITLKGAHFTVVDIPAAKVVASPALTLTQDNRGIAMDGTINIDQANVNVEELPGDNATQASADVVVIDPRQPLSHSASATPFNAQVKVDLGSKTHVVGMGLDGNLSGVLTIIERNGSATIGQGQIAVDGSYKAYGQNLHIDRGQLLFASTPIDNPGLSIRAVHKLNASATIDDGQQVGLLVSGTAQHPILNVFSNPAMEQSDALSYLITGKPLSDVKGGEGTAVSAAAQALGSAGSNLLAKGIGARLGLDDIGVTSSDALNGNSAFTVGKYLSPRLYMSYGVGLFESGQVVTLRYRLTHRWSLEAQTATDFNRANLNYRYEK